MSRVGKKATSCGKKVENWRKNKMHDPLNSQRTRPRCALRLVKGKVVTVIAALDRVRAVAVGVWAGQPSSGESVGETEERPERRITVMQNVAKLPKHGHAALPPRAEGAAKPRRLLPPSEPEWC